MQLWTLYQGTPLHAAITCRSASGEKVQYILQQLHKGCKALQAVNYDGKTPLHLAVSRANSDVIRALARAGCDLNVRSKFLAVVPDEVSSSLAALGVQS